jgi:hypothetical protein
MSLQSSVSNCQCKFCKLIAYLWRIRLIRFGGGACVNLSTKLLLTFIFGAIGLKLWLNYALVHSIIVVISYLYHSSVTFKEEMSFDRFKKFLCSVLILKFLDYLIVVITNNIEIVESYVYQISIYGKILGDNFLYITIVVSTTTVFFIRYFIYKKRFQLK